MSAPRRPSRPTARRRRLLAPLPAVVAALLAGAMLPGPAHAAEGGTGPPRATEAGTPSPSPSPPDDDDTGARLILEPEGGVLDAAEGVAARVTLESPLGLAAIPEGTISLQIGARPLTDRGDLDRWMEGSVPGSFTAADTADTDGVAPGTSLGVELAEDDPAQPRPAGVYPLRAVFDGDGMRLTDDRLVVVSGDERPAVTVVVPLTAPATDRGLLTGDQLAALTAAGGALTAQLDAAVGTQAVLAVDPAIPAAIRALGAAAPRSALDWLDRLETVGNERFALSFGDSDPAVAVAAGQPRPLAPIGLGPYLSGAGEHAAEAPETPTAAPTPTPSPTPTAAPDPSALTTEELLSVGRAVDGIAWPDPAAVDGATVGTLAEADITSLVPSVVTAAGSGGSAVPARADGALVYDSAASALLTTAAATDAEDERDEILDAARASLWLAAAEADAPILVALERAGGVDTGDDSLDRDPSPRPADAVADAVEVATSFGTRSLTTLLADAPVAAEFTGTGPAPERVAAVVELRAAEERLEALGSMLPDPTLLTSRARAEELQLLGVSWSGHLEAWDAAMAGQRESLAGLADAVDIVPPSDVQLLSSEAPLPVWIRNDLPYPVTVTLYTRPDDPRLAVQLVTQVEAAPSQNTRVRVPVEASIGSGRVRLDLSLQSPTGTPVGSAHSINVTVRAEWERAGIAGLAVIIVTLVVAGTIRTVRRRRRAAAARAEHTEPEHARPEHAETGHTEAEESRG